MRSIGLLLVAALLLPGAAARSPCEKAVGFTICVDEEEWGDPECSRSPSSGAGFTWVSATSAQTGVAAGGWTVCGRNHGGESGSHGVFAYGYANAGAASVVWYQSHRPNDEDCAMRATLWTVAGETPVSADCLLPPPDPGWGDVIP